MLTVLQVTPELEAGGVERTTIDIAQALTRSGGRALVASRGGRLELELIANGGELVAMNVQAKDVRVLSNAFRLASLARSKQVDIIHARSRAPAWSALWAARMSGRPFVTTYHGTYNARLGIKRWYNSVMARGDIVIANSAFIGEHIQREHNVSSERIRVIPRGIDTERFDPSAVSLERVEAVKNSWRLDTATAGVVIVLPARLTRWKGQLLAIEALAKVRERGAPRATLVLAGDDQGRTAYSEELEDVAYELGLGEFVKRVGHASDMPAVYAAADLVVCPSIEPEAFGRVAVEAQCMDRPVIAADHGGARETVHEGVGGVRFEPGDPEALANALGEMLALSAHERILMGDKGGRRARREFSIEAMQSATLEVYRELTEDSRDGAGEDEWADATKS